MTEKEALAILGIEEVDAESLSEVYEEACFKEKTLFFKDPVLPLLIDNKLKKITNLYQAFVFLSDRTPSSISVNYELLPLDGNEWDSFFLNYEKNKAVLRKELANHFEGEIINRVLTDLKNNEISYINQLVGLQQLRGETDVRISSQTPVIEILAELNQYLEQGTIDKSWESLSKLSGKKDNFKFGLEITRVNKLING